MAIKPEDLAKIRINSGAQDRHNRIVEKYTAWGDKLSSVTDEESRNKLITEGYGLSDYFKRQGNDDVVTGINNVIDELSNYEKNMKKQADLAAFQTMIKTAESKKAKEGIPLLEEEEAKRKKAQQEIQANKSFAQHLADNLKTSSNPIELFSKTAEDMGLVPDNPNLYVDGQKFNNEYAAEQYRSQKKYENLITAISAMPNTAAIIKKNAQTSGSELSARNGIDADLHDVINGRGTEKQNEAWEKYTLMTEGEKSLYNYLAGLESSKQAIDFLHYLDPVLEQKSADIFADKLDDLPVVVREVAQTATSLGTGVATGFENVALFPARMGAALKGGTHNSLMNQALFSPSQSQMLSSAIIDNEEGFYKKWLQAMNSAGNQIPGLVALAVGGPAGALAYKTILTSGIISSSIQEAALNNENLAKGLVYGVAQASLELAMVKTGISKLSTSSRSSFLMKSLGVIDKVIKNPTLNRLFKGGVSLAKTALEEFGEEWFQAIVDPAFRNIIYKENNVYNEETLLNALEEAIVGAMCSFILGLPTANRSVRQTESDLHFEELGKALGEAGIDAFDVLKLCEETGFTDLETYKQLKEAVSSHKSYDNSLVARTSSEVLQHIYSDNNFTDEYLNLLANKGTAEGIANLMFDGNIKAAQTFKSKFSDMQYIKQLEKPNFILGTAKNYYEVLKGQTRDNTDGSSNVGIAGPRNANGLNAGPNAQSAADRAKADIGTSARDIASQKSRGILGAISAANPKADIVEEMIHKSAGVPWETKDQKLLRKIGSLFGAKVKFEDLDYVKDDGELVSPEGDYDPDTNTITLNTNVKDYHRPVQFILKHELTHSLEKAGVDYEKFMAEVEASEEFEAYVKQRGFESSDKWYEDIINRYAKNGKPLGNETESAETAAKKEAVADFVADVLFDGRNTSLESLLKSLEPETRSGFIECIKEFFAKLKEFFVGKPELTEIEQLEQRFLEVANKVAEMNATDPGQQKTTTEDGSGAKNSLSDISVIDLTDDNELSKKVKGLRGTERHNAIQEYILSVLSEQPITLSDGKQAIVDKSDANHLSSRSGHQRVVYISQIKKIVENAVLVAYEQSNKVGKFDYFYYYEATVRYDGETFPMYLNVGRARNDGTYHIYDISVKIRDTAHRLNDVGRPVGNALENGISTDSIPEKGQPVNSNSMQSGRKYSFAGPQSLSANQENLSEAESREKSRKKKERDSENIRRELGWFRGLDRMWRYEIDDSKAKFNPYSFEGEALFEREEELRLKGDDLSPAEKIELESIQDQLRKRDELSHTLDEYFKHDELYAAYPQLKSTKVEFSGEMNDDVFAEYNPETDTIYLNEERIEELDEAEILHEVQHKIQLIEGFSEGSSIDFWVGLLTRTMEINNIAQNILSAIENEYGAEMAKHAVRFGEVMQRIVDGEESIKLEREINKLFNIAEQKNCRDLFDEYFRNKQLVNYVLKRIGSKTLIQMYEDTAGEIEARDVADRYRMNAKQRQNSRPDIDRTDFVRSEEFISSEEKEKTFASLASSRGYSQKLYHQTGDNFTVFDTAHQKAGKYDPEMPTGTFLKPDDSDIGLSGKKQMELFTKIKNPLEFKNRADAQRFWMRNIEGYAEALRTIDRINERYSREVARAGVEVSEYKKEWRRNNPDADSREIYNDPEFQRLDDVQDRIAREWDDRSNEASLEAKKLIDAYMRDSGYDGVVVENDQGSFGRTVKTYVVFDSSQMKSTNTVTYDDNGNEIPVSARFDGSKKDIRYSLPERKNFASGSRGTENLYDTHDSLKPNSESEWSAFNRSFANKTNGLKNNQKANIMIYTADYAYFVSASGYMRGRIVGKVLIDGNEERINKMTKEFEDGTFVFREGTDTLAQGIRSNRGRGYRHHASLKETLAAEGYEAVDGDEHSGDRGRNYRGSGKTSDNVRLSLPEKDSVRQVADAYRDGAIDFDEYNSRINDLFTQAGEESGTIKPGEIVEPPNKRVPTPKSVSDGTKVRQFARTILESGYATPEMEAYLKELVLEGDFSYTPTSNEKTLEKARKNIESQGYGNAKDNWQRAIAQSNTGADAVATGEALLRLALEHNDAVEAVNIAADLAEFGTRTAQSLQAFSLLKRMGGLGQLVYIQRTVNKLNEDLKKRFKKNTPVVKLDPKLADLLAKAETNGEYDVFYAKIMQDIAAQVPPTFLDKWNAWRYMSMLFNPTTHIRNLTGNGIFLPAVRMKDLVALGMEQFVAEDKRTKVLKVNKEYQQFAEKDFEEVKDIITGSGKYNPSDAVSEYRRIFKNKVLENARKLNFDLLEKEDIIFLKAHYRHALGSFLQARKIDIDNISTAQLVKAREYAMNEALKATYRDASKVANRLSQLSKTGILGQVTIEGLMPFKKTPINIMKRGIEYSPIGLVKTLSKGIYDLKTEEITVDQFIDGLAAGTVGTGVFLLGALLSSLGVAKGGFDDDEEWFRKLNGEQEYSIEIGGKSYTVDWAAPSSIPFFMGVAISEYNADEDADILSMLYDFGMAGFEPILNLTMLSGIEDAISAASYAERGEKATAVFGSAFESFLSQALPTIFGKTANVLDDTRRTSYIDKTSDVPEVVQEALDKIASKTPFASKTRAEYIDAWGETKYTGNFIQRFFQQFVSPGYASTVSVTDVSEEISRLYGVTGEAGVYPSTPKKYVQFKGIRRDLTKEEYYNYATFKGQTQADLVDEAIHSEEYKKLTDEQKAEVIKDIYSYAATLAKCQLDYSYEEITAMVGKDSKGNPILTEEKYNRLDDKARRILVNEYFTESGNVVRAYKTAKNGGSVVEYFVKKVKED